MLTEEQKADVAKWFAAGASLDEIQKRMKAEFGVHMTYLDLRLMVADLPQPVETEPAAPDDVAADGPAHDGPAREVPAPPRRGASWGVRRPAAQERDPPAHAYPLWRTNRYAILASIPTPCPEKRQRKSRTLHGI